MLAHRLTTILPEMSLAEAIDTTRIHRAGLTDTLRVMQDEGPLAKGLGVADVATRVDSDGAKRRQQA